MWIFPSHRMIGQLLRVFKLLQDENFRISPLPLWLIIWWKLKYWKCLVFWSPRIEPKEVANPIDFYLIVYDWSNTCIYISNFWPNPVKPSLSNRKNMKSKVKWGQNYRKFQNLLEMVHWHESHSIGQYRVGNEIHKLCFPFWPPFPSKWTSKFLLPNIGNWPLNRPVIALRSF